MLATKKTAWTLTLICAIFLSACGSSATPTPTVDAGTQLTAIAATVQAQLTQAVAKTPAAPTATNAPTPTVTEVQPTLPVEDVIITAVSTTTGATPGVTPIPTLALVAPTAIPPKSASGDKMQLIGQDPADGTVMKPGQKFKVSWNIRNVGTTTWSKKYQLRFYAGTNLYKESAKTISSVNPPGGDTTFTLEMKAPTKTGDYSSIWVISNADGANFGSVFISIKVKNS